MFIWRDTLAQGKAQVFHLGESKAFRLDTKQKYLREKCLVCEKVETSDSVERKCFA